MAVFIFASDEAAGKNQRDPFLFAGFVAPEKDWSRFLAPAWQERVLDGPPSIPYLHMTDIRSPQWRSDYGLSRLQADDRVDEAVSVIDTMSTLYPICIRVDGGYFRDKFSTRKVAFSKTTRSQPLEPDYVCFLLYVFVVLTHIEKNHPQAEKVDFLVERNGQITKHIQAFHAQMPRSLEALNP